MKFKIPCLYTFSCCDEYTQGQLYASCFWALSQNCEKRLLASCLTVRMEKLDSHWTDFYESMYFSIFRKSVEKSEVSLKSDKNNGYFKEDLCTVMILSR
jgi:hypothetical protein